MNNAMDRNQMNVRSAGTEALTSETVKEFQRVHTSAHPSHFSAAVVVFVHYGKIVMTARQFCKDFHMLQ